MVARELAGMMLMALAGVGVSTMLILETIVGRLNLPYFRLNGTACLCLGIGACSAAWYRGEWSKLTLRQWKWVVVRGSFGTSNWVLSVLAVAAGAPLGDVSALQSINVVVAALLGRAFLGESLRWPHVSALLLSMAGAVLVSRPETLLGLQPAPDGKPWLGYALALAAGTAAGGIFIAARKSQGISAFVLTTSVVCQEFPLLWILPSAGVVDEVPVDSVAASPLAAAALLVGMIFTVGLCSTALSVGAQMCPAAASSTIFTSVNMSLGFGAQMILHNDVPQVTSIVGAGLLLLGVATMAAARALYPTVPKPPAASSKADLSFSAIAGTSSSGSMPDSNNNDGEEDSGSPRSLASFIASEFAGVSPGSAGTATTTARQRRTAAAAAAAAAMDLPLEQVIGAASA